MMDDMFAWLKEAPPSVVMEGLFCFEEMMGAKKAYALFSALKK